MEAMTEMRNRAAVVGVGTTAYGSFPQDDEYSLAANAFRAAVADCGLAKDEIDGLLVWPHPKLLPDGRGSGA